MCPTATGDDYREPLGLAWLGRALTRFPLTEIASQKEGTGDAASRTMF